MNQPLVSIIMPTRNRSEFIIQTVDSVLEQDFRDFELIIINDGSKDNTEDVVKNIEDPRIVYISNKENLGVTKTLNKGIAIARGKYIARIDDQDRWVSKDKLKKQVDFLEKNSPYVLVGTGVIFVSLDNKELFRYLKPKTDTEIRENMLLGNCFVHTSVVFRKDKFLEVGGYDEQFHVGQDYCLWLKLGKKGKMFNFSSYDVVAVFDKGGISSVRKIEQIKRYNIIKKYKNDYPHYYKGLFRYYLRLVLYGYLRLDFLKYITGYMSRKSYDYKTNLENEYFKIPKGSEKYIALQRTGYQVWFNTLFRILRIGQFYDRFLMPKIEILRTRTIRKKFFKDIRDDFLSIKDVLPAEVDNILDIGCGMAGIDLFLYRNYKNQKPDLFLLDKEGVSDIYYGFKEEASFYNSSDLSRKFLTLNGVPQNKIHVIDISKHNFPSENKFELIISLIAWGFHYPVSTYLNEVYQSLSDNGVLIVDIRKGTGGERDLRDTFGNCEVVSEYKKHMRVLARK